MASIQAIARSGVGVWDVRWRDKGRQKSKRFTLRADAEAFAATLGGIGRRGGAHTRTASEIVGLILRTSRIDRRGCWVWTGSLMTSGYGQLRWNGAPSGRQEAGAHRISYFVHVGSVTPDLVIDHLCRNRACVNPDHLEPVTQRENCMRSPITQGAINAKKTHCPRGHAYTADNTLVLVNPAGRSTTARACRTCIRNRPRARKAVAS